MDFVFLAAIAAFWAAAFGLAKACAGLQARQDKS